MAGANGGISFYDSSSGTPAPTFTADAAKVAVPSGSLQLFNGGAASKVFAITYADTGVGPNTATFHSIINGQDATLAVLDQNGKFTPNAIGFPDGSSLSTSTNLVTTSTLNAFEANVPLLNASVNNFSGGIGASFLNATGQVTAASVVSPSISSSAITVSDNSGNAAQITPTSATFGSVSAKSIFLNGQPLTRGIQSFKANAPLTASTDANGNATAGLTVGSGLLVANGSLNVDSGYIGALAGSTPAGGDARGPLQGMTVLAAEGRFFGITGSNFVNGNVFNVSPQGTIVPTQPVFFAKLAAGGPALTNGVTQTLNLSYTSNGTPVKVSLDFGVNCSSGAIPATVFVNVASGNTLLFTRQNTAAASNTGWIFSVTGFDIQTLPAGAVNLTFTIGTNSSGSCSVTYGTGAVGIS